MAAQMIERNPDNPYLDTIARMEPDIAMIDAAAGWASIAVSLKRIADTLERLEILLLIARTPNGG